MGDRLRQLERRPLLDQLGGSEAHDHAGPSKRESRLRIARRRPLALPPGPRIVKPGRARFNVVALRPREESLAHPQYNFVTRATDAVSLAGS
jgi:hypothetical protein